jgi:hypothetical protein
MFSPQALLKGLVRRVLPIPQLDAPEAEIAVRMGRYGDVKVESAWPTEHVLSDEGAYYYCDLGSPIAQGGTAGTRGTAITLGLPAGATIVVAAANILAISNVDNPISQGGLGKSIYVRRIQIVTEEATVPATTTAVAWGFAIDAVNRTPSSTVVGPLVPVNVNGNVVSASISRVYCCNAASGLTTPAAGSALRTFSGYFKFAASVTKDVYEVQFGGVDPAALFTQAATVAQKYVEKAPPFVIGPQQWGLFYLSMPGAATNNVTYEPFLELVEK